MRLSPDIRGTFSKLVKKDLTVTRIVELFETNRAQMDKARQTCGQRKLPGLFCLIMELSLKSDGKTGADSTALRLILLIRLIPKIRVRLSGALKPQPQVC